MMEERQSIRDKIEQALLRGRKRLEQRDVLTLQSPRFAVWGRQGPKQAPLITSDYKLLRMYGLRREDVELMREKQGWKCAICLRHERLVVDHCHSTGHVRGLLCNTCNVWLGAMKDNAQMLRRAANYLEKS